MEENKSSVPENVTVIRYNILYSVCMLIAAIIMIIIFMIAKEKEWYYDFFLILAVLFLFDSIYALIRGKYVWLDKQNKTVKIYNTPIFPARKYKYDHLFFKGNRLYCETGGENEFINILRYQCRKDDYEAFVAEVNKGV
jgi:hypothetical protein